MIRVFGDIMLDRWIQGNADRISPEAPVPVLLEESQSYSIGGAGNLALNIQSINGSVALHGSVGQDKEGMKVTELLKQNQYSPMTIAEQVVSIFTGVNGYLDDLELNQIRDFEKDLFELIKSSHSDIIESINSSGDLNDDTSSKLTSIIEEFKKNR